LGSGLRRTAVFPSNALNRQAFLAQGSATERLRRGVKDGLLLRLIDPTIFPALLP
jgi:hypothetical protein